MSKLKGHSGGVALNSRQKKLLRELEARHIKMGKILQQVNAGKITGEELEAIVSKGFTWCGAAGGSGCTIGGGGTNV